MFVGNVERQLLGYAAMLETSSVEKGRLFMEGVLKAQEYALSHPDQEHDLKVRSAVLKALAHMKRIRYLRRHKD